ncbi:MAG: hypothetical protein GYB36_11805 [Alphaproteobacteria bacterium]|nr:hypothetical protein [Alphaproteobacteria bacterium]
MKTHLALTSIIVLGALSASPGTAQTSQQDARTLDPQVYTARLAQASQQQPSTPLQRVQNTNLQDAVNRDAILQRDVLQGRARPDSPRIMPINWGQAREDVQRQSRLTSSEFTTTAALRLVQRFPRPDNQEAAGITETRLPVLMPTIEALGLGETPLTRLFPRENFYTLSIRGPRILIEVFGTRLAHAEPPDAASERRLRARASNFDISQTRYGIEVNFNRYGAAYSITIECDNPRTDPRCSETNYARRLAETLVIAAGSPGEGEL